jgi:hypothetical protein
MQLTSNAADAYLTASTAELAGMLALHPFTIGKIFPTACLGWASQWCPHKVYSLAKVAEQVSAASGFTVEPAHLLELVTRTKAIALLKEHCRGRAPRTWSYWADHGIGPRIVRVGGCIRYIRDDVIACGQCMGTYRRRLTEWDMQRMRRAVAPTVAPKVTAARSGPNARYSQVTGDAGGAVQSSPPVVGP